jgi:hypothetical protein
VSTPAPCAAGGPATLSASLPSPTNARVGFAHAAVACATLIALFALPSSLAAQWKNSYPKLVGRSFGRDAPAG